VRGVRLQKSRAQNLLTNPSRGQQVGSLQFAGSVKKPACFTLAVPQDLRGGPGQCPPVSGPAKTGFLTLARTIARSKNASTGDLVRSIFGTLAKSQNAMAMAMLYPESPKGRGNKNPKNLGFNAEYLRMARKVLRTSEPLAKSVLIGSPSLAALFNLQFRRFPLSSNNSVGMFYS